MLAGVADAEAGLSGSRGASGTAGETSHIGSSLRAPKTTRWNPSAKGENCIACVASYMTERLNGAAGEFLSADDVERIYASVHPSRGLQLPEAVEILHRVSKSDMAPVRLSPFAEGAPVGQYALFLARVQTSCSM